MTTTTAPVVKINKNIILAIATITAFILPFLVAAVNVALPTMARELKMEAVTMAWVGTSYFLAIGVVQVPFGRLSDIFGRRRLFILGLVLSTLGSFLGAFATSVPVLLASRVLQGFGSGITFNVAVAILSAVFPGKERAKALGISQSGTYLGLSLGPLFGGFLTEQFGWKSIFLISGILGALLVIMVITGLKAEWREARGEKFDIKGSIIYIIGIASFFYGFSSLPSLTGIILCPIGAAALVLFVWWESRVPSPIFNINLFRGNRVFIFSNIAALVTYLATFAINTLLSLYLQYIKGFRADKAGLVLICASVLMTTFTILAGFLAQKVESRLLATLGMGLDLIATVMLIFLGNDTAIWYVILALMIYGTGIGLFVSPNTNAIMGSVDKKVLGVASGTLGTMRTAGMMLSMAITMVLFSVYIGAAEITSAYYPQFLTSVRVGFIIFSACGLGGLIAQMIARNRDAHHRGIARPEHT
jgi:EmrB/QacA subfamily drug resistance transporter